MIVEAFSQRSTVPHITVQDKNSNFLALPKSYYFAFKTQNYCINDAIVLSLARPPAVKLKVGIFAPHRMHVLYGVLHHFKLLFFFILVPPVQNPKFPHSKSLTERLSLSRGFLFIAAIRSIYFQRASRERQAGNGQQEEGRKQKATLLAQFEIGDVQCVCVRACSAKPLVTET